MSTAQAMAAYLADDPFWAAELIAQLEELSVGTALEWATNTFVALVKAEGPPYKENLLSWIEQLPLVSEEAIAAEPDKLDTIWYENEDAFHKALSHLFAAKGRLLRQERGAYRYHLVTALRFLGNDASCRQTAASVPFSLLDKYIHPE